MRSIFTGILIAFLASATNAEWSREKWERRRLEIGLEEADMLLAQEDSPRYGGQGMNCENPWGNPCGPDGICSNTATGYHCDPVDGIFDDCATGCGPHTFCEQVSEIRKMCLCVGGYHRLEPHLPCVPIVDFA